MEQDSSKLIAFSVFGGVVAFVPDALRLSLIENRVDSANAKITAEQQSEVSIKGLISTATKEDQPAAMPFLQDQLEAAQGKVQALVAERPAINTTHEYGFAGGLFVVGALCAAGITRYVQRRNQPKRPVHLHRVV